MRYNFALTSIKKSAKTAMLFLTEIFLWLNFTRWENTYLSGSSQQILWVCLGPLKSPQLASCFASKTTEAQRHSQVCHPRSGVPRTPSRTTDAILVWVFVENKHVLLDPKLGGEFSPPVIERYDWCLLVYLSGSIPPEIALTLQSRLPPSLPSSAAAAPPPSSSGMSQDTSSSSESITQPAKFIKSQDE